MEKLVITAPKTARKFDWLVAHRGSDVMDFAKAQGWKDVRICGSGKMITSPVEHDSGWKLTPYDGSIIPVVARQMLKKIDEAGITYRGLVIAHEPEIDTPAPIVEERGDLFNKKWLKYAGLGALAVALSPVAVVAAGVILVGGAATLALGAISYVALGDPALIIVCDDGTWIELHKWYS